MSEARAAALASFDALAAAHRFRDDVNCQWRVAARPKGNVVPSDFAWREEPIPEPGPDEALLKTLYLGLAPVMRFYMQGTGAAGERSLRPGDVIHGRGVAQVIASRREGVGVGEIWQGQMGWQGYKATAMTPQERFYRVRHTDLSPALSAGVLAMTGLSAHAGFFACGAPRPGDKVLVSGAAGGVGSIVAQLARIAGCEVVGIAGGPDKCAFVRSLGCTAAIDYRQEDVRARIAQLFPTGVDLYFDNVGGEILMAALDHLAMNGRVVLCGSISEYTRAEPFGPTNYTALRRVEGTMRGFFVYNHVYRFDAIMDDLAGWIRDGRLKPVQDVIDGFAFMPRALANLYYGGNVGVQCCRVRGEADR
ncbi:MAG: NADP-dependent oxidoreductase [Caulobacterales bacterium]|nr:NADP-dependent oxidoreductase [Caulobacterales bacterium]